MMHPESRSRRHGDPVETTSWRDHCIECGARALDACGCCGLPLCGRHHEVQGGFCSYFSPALAAGLPACVDETWGVTVNLRYASIHDDVAVLVTPGSVHDRDVYHVPADDGDDTTAPLCRPAEDGKERLTPAAAVKDELELCSNCEIALLEATVEAEDDA
jgi:hypothetical protein